MTTPGAQGQDWAERRADLLRRARAVADEFEAITAIAQEAAALSPAAAKHCPTCRCDPVCPDCGERPPGGPAGARLIDRFRLHECGRTEDGQ